MFGRRPAAVLLVLAAAATLGGPAVAAEAPLTTVWERTAGGPQRDGASAVAAAGGDDGDLYLAGVRGTETGTRALLERRTAAGDLVWSRTYGDPGADGALDVLAVPGDGALLLGDTVPPGRDRDVVLRRVGPDGDVRWTRTYGGSGEETAYTLVRAGGGYAFAGFTTTDVAGDMAAWLVRLGPDGDVRWTRTYSAGRLTAAYDLVRTPTGFALGGVTTDGRTVLQGGDGWLARTDGNGTLRWSRTYGGSGGESLRGLVRTADGFAAAGFTTSSGNGVSSAWLLRVAGDGTARWNRTYGAGITVAADLARTAEGFLLLGEGAPDGDFDIQFRRVTHEGQQVGVRSVGGDGEEGAGDLLVVDGRALAAGGTTTATDGPSDALLLAVTAPAPATPLADGGPWADLAVGLALLLGAVVAAVVAVADLGARR